MANWLSKATPALPRTVTHRDLHNASMHAQASRVPRLAGSGLAAQGRAVIGAGARVKR